MLRQTTSVLETAEHDRRMSFEGGCDHFGKTGRADCKTTGVHLAIRVLAAGYVVHPADEKCGGVQ
jgi:hypothetical protein